MNDSLEAGNFCVIMKAGAGMLGRAPGLSCSACSRCVSLRSCLTRPADAAERGSRCLKYCLEQEPTERTEQQLEGGGGQHGERLHSAPLTGCLWQHQVLPGSFIWLYAFLSLISDLAKHAHPCPLNSLYFLLANTYFAQAWGFFFFF